MDEKRSSTAAAATVPNVSRRRLTGRRVHAHERPYESSAHEATTIHLAGDYSIECSSKGDIPSYSFYKTLCLTWNLCDSLS